MRLRKAYRITIVVDDPYEGMARRPPLMDRIDQMMSQRPRALPLAVEEFLGMTQIGPVPSVIEVEQFEEITRPGDLG